MYRTSALITDGQARRIAADWHGGQTSALYTLASTGAIVDGLQDEIRREIRAAGDDSDGVLALRGLMKYTLSRIRLGQTGKVLGWSRMRDEIPVTDDQAS